MKKNHKHHVGILGRPNVGKSTLFNVLVRRKDAIVKNLSGVTRDILFGDASWWGSDFKVVDTGGLHFGAEGFSRLIFQQVLESLDMLDSFIFVLDAKTGLLPDDFDILRLLEKTGKPVLCVVNKVDQFEDCDITVSDFYRLGRNFYVSSFEQRQGVDLIVEWIKSQTKEHKNPKVNKNIKRTKLAIVGKPNVGKSSLTNQILGVKRSLTSEVSGTTLDSVKEDFEFRGQHYTLLDTAGLRASSKRVEHLEKVSSIYSYRSMQESDISVLLVDATQDLSHQDCDILESVIEKGKPVILGVNKMDLIKEDRDEFVEKFYKQLEKKFHFFRKIPVVFLSAETGEGVLKLFKTVGVILKKMNTSIPTSELNRFFYAVTRKVPAPVYGVSNVKFYYLTQTKQTPPSFIAFANHPEGVEDSYRRFIVKSIQKNWGLEKVPVRLHIMKK